MITSCPGHPRTGSPRRIAKDQFVLWLCESYRMVHCRALLARAGGVSGARGLCRLQGLLPKTRGACAI